MEQIFVVDDDSAFRKLLKTVLEMEGYQAFLIGSSVDVIPRAREVEPALILMDVHIGEEDALETLRALKRDEYLKDVPVVMTSGMDRAEECLCAGADAFVLKPFRPSRMLNRITNLIEAAS